VALIWTLALRDVNSGERRTVRARTIVNAAGPWVEDVRSRCAGLPARAHTRLVQGSHIVVRRLFNHDRAYILQNPDNRIVFAIPYDRDFTLIGTTDHDFEGNPNAPMATPEEIDWFVEMLRRGAPSLNQQDLASVHAWLTAHSPMQRH